MRVFYRAINMDGQMISKSTNVDNIENLRIVLKNNDYYLLDYKVKNEKIFGSIKKIDIIDFFKGLSILLKAGIDLNTSLSLMKDSMNENFTNIIDEMVEDLEKGNFLSDAIKRQEKIYSNLSYFLIKIGENSGRLDQNIEYLSEILDYQENTRREIRSSLTYPIILLLASTFLFIFIATYLLPSFLKVFDYKEDLPLITRMVYEVGSFINLRYKVLMISVFLAGLVFIYKLEDSFFKARFKGKILKLPLVRTIYETFTYSYYSKALAIMLESGENLLNSLNMSAMIFDDMNLSEKAIKIEENIIKGDSFSKSLEREGIFSKEIRGIVRVGEESGNLDMVLKNISLIYEKKAENLLNKYTKLLEPMLLIIITIFIAFLTISLILPIFKIIDLI